MIKITDRIYIGADDYCWTVYKKGIRKKGQKKGEVFYEGLTYHPSLEHAILSINEHLTRREFKDTEITLNRALKTFRGIRDDLVKAMKEVEYE